MMGTAADGDEDDRTVLDRRDPLVGTVLDQRFRIDYQLAAGGFGAIYCATDVLADAEVALKVLLPRLARDPMVVARFRREGKMLGALRDPHTVTAYEIGEASDGTLYIVMELLRGESLYQRFRRQGALPWRRALHVARGVCSSLAEAHALGVVHRDLKPANIHLELRDGDPDFAKVLDFGIAKIVQGNGVEHTQLTQAGQMIGTVEYMSPEQMTGGELTPRSDIYTLGIVMYEMIAGRTPFADAQTATAILSAVLTQAPPPVSSHAQVPPRLDQIIARCLEREPENRFGDIADLADALASVAAAGVVRSSPSVPATGFEQAVLTGEATRIDVRFTESSQPVLDARGPRHRLADGPGAPTGYGSSDVEGGSGDGLGSADRQRAAPRPAMPAGGPRHPTPAAPIAAVAKARGSQHAIDVRRLPPGRGAQPVHPDPPGTPVGWPPPAAVASAPRMQAMQAMQPPRQVVHTPAPPLPVVMPGLPGAPPTPMPPPARPAAYTAPSYDLIADASYDKMVRRIIWIAVLIAVIAAVVIATR